MAGGGEGRPPRRLADNDGTTDSEAAPAPPPPACRTTWLVHVGKTGGTALEAALGRGRAASAAPGARQLRVPGTHEFVLGGAPARAGRPAAADCYAVFARDPVERWASGWLSRYRRGCRGWAEAEAFHCRRWTPAERAGFEAFRSPEALALALADPQPAVRAAALAAEQSSLHTRQGFAHYLPDLPAFLATGRVAFVGRAEHLAEDLQGLLEAAGVAGPASVPLKGPAWPWSEGFKGAAERSFVLDPAAASGALPALPEAGDSEVHRVPDRLKRFERLSRAARCALEEHLAEDYEILAQFARAGLLPEGAYARQCPDGLAGAEFADAGPVDFRAGPAAPPFPEPRPTWCVPAGRIPSRTPRASATKLHPQGTRPRRRD